MRLSFRHRVFLGLVGLGTVPLAAALAVLALQIRSGASPAGPRAALDEIAASSRETIGVLDTAALDDSARAAVRGLMETIAERTTLARRAETLTRTAAGALAAVAVIAALVVIAASVTVARRLSAYTSAPIEELVQWVRQIEHRAALPDVAHPGGAPEFDALRTALRAMSEALERARRQELEQERLAAFRETARHVAHEMRGPLTATRLAIRQLARYAAENPRGTDAIAVLTDESERLERMAREFSEFGRLPEGPEAAVDIGELVRGVASASAADGCPVTCEAGSGLSVRGHYEPLRRAVQNLVRNAIDVTDERGVSVTAMPLDEAGRRQVVVRVRDHGPGVPDSVGNQVFDPYVTTKRGGTGLGLALARQTVLAHGGSIAFETADGGGASFVIALPAADTLE